MFTKGNQQLLIKINNTHGKSTSECYQGLCTTIQSILCGLEWGFRFLTEWPNLCSFTVSVHSSISIFCGLLSTDHWWTVQEFCRSWSQSSNDMAHTVKSLSMKKILSLWTKIFSSTHQHMEMTPVCSGWYPPQQILQQWRCISAVLPIRRSRNTLPIHLTWIFIISTSFFSWKNPFKWFLIRHLCSKAQALYCYHQQLTPQLK